MGSQLKKEISVKTKTPFISKIGTLNRNNNNVVYIKSKARITPLNDKNTYRSDVIDIKNDFVNNVKEIVSNNGLLTKEHIAICDLSENNLVYKKNSRVKFEVFVRLNNNDDFELYKHELSNITNNFNKTVEEIITSKGFKCY